MRRLTQERVSHRGEPLGSIHPRRCRPRLNEVPRGRRPLTIGPMVKYPNQESQTTIEHRPKRTVRVVLASVVALIVLFGVLAHLHRPISGTVTSFNATSITIRPSGSSVTKSYGITNTTMVGLPKSSSDYGVPQHFNIKYFHDGETVAINVGPNNEAQAITVGA
jgi:hypothetical protein